MFTLKIRWMRHEGDEPGKPVGLADETTLFLPADEVEVHGAVTGADWQATMGAWGEGDYHQYLCVTYFAKGDPQFMDGRLILRRHGGSDRWYLASLAWLLGPDGRTIERLV